MEVQYIGHPQTEVQVNLSQDDFSELDSIMRQAFLESVEYGSFNKNTMEILPESTGSRIFRFCEKFGVDGEYTKDRLSFFKAILAVK